MFGTEYGFQCSPQATHNTKEKKKRKGAGESEMENLQKGMFGMDNGFKTSPVESSTLEEREFAVDLLSNQV